MGQRLVDYMHGSALSSMCDSVAPTTANVSVAGFREVNEDALKLYAAAKDAKGVIDAQKEYMDRLEAPLSKQVNLGEGTSI